MRYQDWDVLLFPEDCHVPFKEFKTSCYGMRALDQEGRELKDCDGDSIITPLLTSFTPAVPQGSHFTISVHAWILTMHPAVLDGDTAYKKYLWQVRVIIDGVCVTTKHFPARCNWPQVISTTGGIGAAGQPLGPALEWPTYPKSAASQRDWDAASNSGRIKVELSSGFTIQVGEHVSYNKLTDVVCFSFFPAPIDHLERVGIAWPNLPMFTHPIGPPPAGEPTLAPLFDGTRPGHAMHKRNISQGSINFSSPLHSLPQPPPPTPVMGLHHYQLQAGDMHSNYDASSRSTSGYTNGVDITHAMPYGLIQDYSLSKSGQFQVRLPSDQLQQIINAVHSSDYRPPNPNITGAMPPPPVPLRAIAPRSEVETFGQRLPSAPTVDGPNRRGESRSSDISMHPGCTSYPTCLVENDQGQIVHSSPATPSTIIKGKKEGSSPTKPHDYLSTILVPQPSGQVPVPSTEQATLTSSSPADSIGRKRTRSSLRSLTINEGSPEKREPTKKPPRKASKASISSNASNSTKTKEKRDGAVMVDPIEDKENMMVVDV